MAIRGKVIQSKGLRTQIGGQAAPKAFVHVDGVEEAIRRIGKLARDAQGRILIAAMMDGAEVIRKKVEDYAPRPTKRRHPEVGRLGDNIIKMVFFRGNNRVEVGVLPDYRESKVGHLVEKGHDWWWGGHMEKRPFMKPAYNATKARALQVVHNRLQQEVNRTTRKLNKEG